MEIPSTSIGILKQSISTRDERYMRPFFQWQVNGDNFLDGTQTNCNNCFENLNSSHEKSMESDSLQHSTGTCISQFFNKMINTLAKVLVKDSLLEK